MFEHKLDSLSNSEYNDPISNRGSGNFNNIVISASGSSNRNVLIENSPGREEKKPKVEEDEAAMKEINKLQILKKLSENEETKEKEKKDTLGKQQSTQNQQHVKFKLKVESEEEEKPKEEEEEEGNHSSKSDNDNFEESEVKLNKSYNFENLDYSPLQNAQTVQKGSNLRLNQTSIGYSSNQKQRITFKNVFMSYSRKEIKYERILQILENNDVRSSYIKIFEKKPKFSIILKNTSDFIWPIGLKLELFLNDKSKPKSRSKTAKKPIHLFSALSTEKEVNVDDVYEFTFDFGEIFEEKELEKLNMLLESGYLKLRFSGVIDRIKYFSMPGKIGFEVVEGE